MKNWTQEELNLAKQEVKNGKTYQEISVMLNRTPKSVKVKLTKERCYRKQFINTDNIGKCVCLNCGNEFDILINRKRERDRKFCSHNCSSIYNNKLRDKKVNEKIKNSLLERKIKIKSYCVNCNTELTLNQKRYCTGTCKVEYERNIKIQKWLSGEHNGSMGENSTALWIKYYLIQERGEKCEECGWNKVNPTTNIIPIELVHIDGDHTNNKIENLKLLCPSCHSLTPTYKGANTGNGRHNRRKRYKEGKSY